MKVILDFFPIIVFFVLFKIFNIYIGTIGLMASSVIQMILLKYIYGKIEFMYKLSCIFIIIFGSVTLIFHNVMFLKWKITVLNWLLAALFLGSQLFTEQSFIERMMSSQMLLPKVIWSRLNMMWGAYFLIVGAINLYVIYHYSTSDWVNFKLFGMLVLTIIFVFIQTIYLLLVIRKYKDQLDIGPKSNTKISKEQRK
jgi:intracellular septation protein